MLLTSGEILRRLAAVPNHRTSVFSALSCRLLQACKAVHHLTLDLFAVSKLLVFLNVAGDPSGSEVVPLSAVESLSALSTGNLMLYDFLY